MSVQPTNRTTVLDFRHDQNGIYATIDTNRLHLRSINEDDLQNCHSLYSNPTVMGKFHDGKTRTLEQTTTRVNNLAKRWINGDPFSGFAVFVKQDGGREKFAGLAVLGHGDHPGEA